TPAKRLEAVEKLTAAGIPTAVMTAPLIPALNDHEVEALLQAAAEHGASEAGYVLLRLPLEIKDLFAAWLEAHLPDKASHVMNLLTSMHAGRAYRAAFGLRQTGRGPYADQLAQRFKLALRRNGLNRRRLRLRTDLFVPPPQPGDQMRLI
ncbi:MAG: radical SAM protein, partial [Pseudomonadota bacterium]